MTIEDLERGMKIRWDAHVHSADRLGRIEVLQEKAELEMAELRASERTMLDGLASLARVVTNIGEAQARTEASVAAFRRMFKRRRSVWTPLLLPCITAARLSSDYIRAS